MRVAPTLVICSLPFIVGKAGVAFDFTSGFSDETRDALWKGIHMDADELSESAIRPGRKYTSEESSPKDRSDDNAW